MTCCCMWQQYTLHAISRFVQTGYHLSILWHSSIRKAGSILGVTGGMQSDDDRMSRPSRYRDRLRAAPPAAGTMQKRLQTRRLAGLSHRNRSYYLPSSMPLRAFDWHAHLSLFSHIEPPDCDAACATTGPGIDGQNSAHGTFATVTEDPIDNPATGEIQHPPKKLD